MEAPYNIQNHRRELCKSCKTPCEYQNDAEFRKEGDNVCPINRWKEWKTYVKVQMKGAGDLVAAVAQPIAGAIDAVLKTKVRTCGACAKRREMLNQLIPFGKK